MIPLIIGAAAGAVGTFAVSKMLSKDKNFYTTKEVADLLKMSEYTVRKKIRNGEIKAERGKAHIINKEDLADYIKNNLHATELLGQGNAESFSPEILGQIMEVKEMDLKRLKLQLQKLELEEDEYEPKEFQKKKISLEIEINEMDSELKTYQIINALNSKSEEKK